MSEFYYDQIIEYIDGTFDENFEAAKKWAEVNNARFVEIAPKSETIRQFQIIELTYAEQVEEVRKTREQLYKEYKDPITCQIQSLRDEDVITPELEAEIAALIEKRKQIVAKIKEDNPYPEQKSIKIEENTEKDTEAIEEKSTIL